MLNGFEEKDVEKMVKLMNLTHNRITGLDGKEAFEYRDLMAWAQQILVPRMKDLIVGDVKVHEAQPPEKVSKAKKKSK